MFRLFTSVCLCWICVSVFLCGCAALTSNISTQNELPNLTVWDSTFLQLRDRLSSYLQPMRPYTLLIYAEDHRYIPKPRHRRPSQLLRLLGSSFHPFWMSIDQPYKASGGHGIGRPLMHGKTATIRGKVNLSLSSELREAAQNHRQKLEKEVAELDLSSLPSHVAMSVRGWLLHSAACELHYQWVDLGPAFWPRWLRQTDCKTSDRVHHCSFPRGMECGERSDGSIEVGTGETIKRCLWRQVPYPVVTACTCACK
ncbi:hypothetical protein Q5P01_026167 [Channa striata]|uniref:Noggin n=1 Tax=Channa striata TaxID=64152 RepID=A0AA88LGW2_CHASR|nr:hypothetical protein Q5P01_026167 [Channa striata]